MKNSPSVRVWECEAVWECVNSGMREWVNGRIVIN